MRKMFNLNEVVETNDYDVMPAGYYKAFCDKAEWKTSKAGSKYLNICFKIFGEQYENRVVFSMYNLYHEKENVKNIAMSDLKKMFLASGLTPEQMNFATEEALITAVLNVRCRIKLGIRKSTEYGDQNEVKSYQELDEKNPSAAIDETDIPF